MSTLICGFDIWPGGRATPAPDILPRPMADATWRWLHFEVAGLNSWADEHLPPFAGATLCQPETRPRCEAFPEGVAINLRDVNLNEGDQAEDMISLRIWATEDLIVTARLRKVMTIDRIRHDCEAGIGPGSSGKFLDAIAKGLLDHAEQTAANLEEATNALEEASLSNDGTIGNADNIVRYRRAVIMLRRFAAPQRDALTKLAILEGSLLSKQVRLRIRESANRATRLSETLDALRDRLAVLQDHADARANQNMGRNSYLLSVVAAIFLPLGFATGLFGVNVAGMPGVNDPSAFWLLTAAMTGFGVALLAVFRWMRWF
ncbi:MAG: zinc transporter ZntB [Pikeienuella sp.]